MRGGGGRTRMHRAASNIRAASRERGVVSRRDGRRRAAAESAFVPAVCSNARLTGARQVSAMSASTCAGCSAALATFFQCLRTLPSGPIQTVERITPTVFLPYSVFSP